MTKPGNTVETLADPGTYTPAQLRLACRIAGLFNRGRFILTESPRS